MLTDDELHRVMNPPKDCVQCGAPYDLRRQYDAAGELILSERVCGRCGDIERRWGTIE